MLSTRILDLDIGPNVTHLATDWEIATDTLFVNKVASSINDTVNLTSIVFDIIVDPTIKYYARARSLIDPGGYTVWGNIDTFTPKDINDIEADVDLPTYVTLPTISTTDYTNVFPTTLFTITLSGYANTGPASHDSTTWIIEDIHGNVVYSRLKDKFNKNSLTFTDVILESRKLYRIKAIYHSTSNDSSQIATMTVSTDSNRYTRVISSLSGMDSTIANSIKLNFVPNVTSTVWEIIRIIDNQATSVYSNTLTESVFDIIIPANTLTNNQLYLLKVKTDLDIGYNYQSFRSL